MSRCEVSRHRPITGAVTQEVRLMTGGAVDPTLQTSVKQGRYVVDSREVAEAIVRSWMLVAAEPGHGPVRAEEDEVAAG